MAEPTTATERQPGTEPDLAALRARVACLDVIDAIFRWVDAGEAARTVELFTPDGELVMGPSSFSGAGLTAAMQARQEESAKQGVHVPAASSFRLLSPTEAEAQTYLHLYRQADQRAGAAPLPRAVTLLTDRFVKGEDGRWLIARRVVDIVAGGE
ncbi:nuclear transport factor 2 family protein [Streptomyces sp. PA03-3a]|nr:nuclear transport factor 2 family protein [Streptomyces sp. PA03-3a]